LPVGLAAGRMRRMG